MGQLKTFAIILNSNQNVFHPGQYVNGKCIIETNSEIMCKFLKINIKGIAKVEWTGSFNDGTDHYRSEVRYFNYKQILHENQMLTVGYHEFPFSYQLPENIPTSFEGEYGSIRYWIEAKLLKSLFIHKTMKAFTVIQTIDINREEYLLPVQSQYEKTLGCCFMDADKVYIYAKTDRTGYCPGQSIAITALFENYSQKTITPLLTIYQKQTYFTSRKSKVKKEKSIMFTGEPIPPNKKSNWNKQLFRIPQVAPSIMSCRIIKVEYFVKITLLNTGKLSDLKVRLPIVIGTVPYNQPPSYLTLSDSDIASTSQDSPLPSLLPNDDLPPTYAECISDAVDIRDDKDGQNDEIIGDTKYIPLYTYVDQPPKYASSQN